LPHHRGERYRPDAAISSGTCLIAISLRLNCEHQSIVFISAFRIWRNHFQICSDVVYFDQLKNPLVEQGGFSKNHYLTSKQIELFEPNVLNTSARKKGPNYTKTYRARCV
jgi:hypothetical protein